MSTTTEISNRQREILEHSLGNQKHYRNYYATHEEAGGDFETISELIDMGLMERGRAMPAELGGMAFFHVTEAGKALTFLNAGMDPLAKVWDNEDGDIFAEGHIEPDLFIQAARAWWEYTTGDMDGWEEHYGDMEAKYVEHVWWRPDPELGLSWDNDLCDVPGEWSSEPAENAKPYTRYQA